MLQEKNITVQVMEVLLNNKIDFYIHSNTHELEVYFGNDPVFIQTTTKNTIIEEGQTEFTLLQFKSWYNLK